MDPEYNEYEFFETPATINSLPWKNIIIGVVILVFVILFVRFTRRRTLNRKWTRPTRDLKKESMKVSTDDSMETMTAHMRDLNDPLVLVYNRPDIVMNNAAIRADVVDRMKRTIMDEHFDDLEILERIVNINEDLDLDPEIGAQAIEAATRIGYNRQTARNNDPVRTFEARAVDVTRQMDDPQNVHDPTVIKQLNDQLHDMDHRVNDERRRNRNDGAGADMNDIDNMTDITEFVDRMKESGDISNQRSMEALKAARKMINSQDTCTSYSGRVESEIFKTAWNSAKSYDERHNIILGLADSTTHEGTVCMNGRIARVLGANTVQATGPEIKSAIYSYAGKIMNDGGAFNLVEQYIDDIKTMPDSQKELVKAECRAVFDDNDDEPVAATVDQ